jgi:O-antigen/teichoic acid export membrane protein
MRRDVISAYAATGAKIGSWVIVLGLAYRFGSPAEFALLALVRGTIGILNYTTLGLSPAMIRLIAEARGKQPAPTSPQLGYFNSSGEGIQTIYANGSIIALVCGVVGVAVSFLYARYFNVLFVAPPQLQLVAPYVAAALGVGTVFRLMGDAPGSVLQANERIATDNFIVAAADLFFAAACAASLLRGRPTNYAWLIAMAYGASGFANFILRDMGAGRISRSPLPRWRLFDEKVIRRLLGFGSLILFAQLADYLYAPTDYILINRLLGFDFVGIYTPAMQIDAGLLLLVTGLSSVILPRSAIAHTAGDIDRVRRYYVWGTILSATLLLFAAGVVWLASGLIFRLWLGNPMPATQTILPLVLIHTVIGGSSAVGRSVLLGTGQARPFTAAVLIAGVCNVLLSYVFVRHLHLALPGIVLGTIVVVVARCAIWMPWYVLRTLRKQNEIPTVQRR